MNTDSMEFWQCCGGACGCVAGVTLELVLEYLPDVSGEITQDRLLEDVGSLFETADFHGELDNIRYCRGAMGLSRHRDLSMRLYLSTTLSNPWEARRLIEAFGQRWARQVTGGYGSYVVTDH